MLVSGPCSNNMYEQIACSHQNGFTASQLHVSIAYVAPVRKLEEFRDQPTHSWIDQWPLLFLHPLPLGYPVVSLSPRLSGEDINMVEQIRSLHSMPLAALDIHCLKWLCVCVCVKLEMWTFAIEHVASVWTGLRTLEEPEQRRTEKENMSKHINNCNRECLFIKSYVCILCEDWVYYILLPSDTTEKCSH